jgi:hypothetical protein
MPCIHDISAARETSDRLSPNLFHDQWKLIMDIPPQSHESLQDAARLKFNSLLNLPEHSLRKLYEEVDLIKSGRYSLVPILPPDVKHNSRGRPRTGSQKAPAVSKHGRWKSRHEVEETKRKKKQKSKRRRLELAELTELEKELDDDPDPSDEDHSDAENKSKDPTASTSESNITNVAAKRVYKCGKCGNPGHRAPKCPLQLLSIEMDMNEEDSLPDLNLYAEDDRKLNMNKEDSLPPIAEEADESDTPSEPANDKGLCAFCDEVMPAIPSNKLLSLKAKLMALPNITQGIGRPGARSLPVSKPAF